MSLLKAHSHIEVLATRAAEIDHTNDVYADTRHSKLMYDPHDYDVYTQHGSKYAQHSTIGD